MAKKGKGRPRKILTRDDIERAMKSTLSNMAASRYLHVSYPHYRKYAKQYIDEETGKTLFDLHKNEAGKGIPKFRSSEGKLPPLMDVIEGRVPIEHFSAKKMKERLVYEGLLKYECYSCGFSERRVADSRIPLIMHHKDNNKKNYRLENLELLCYNCSFLYAVSPITDEQVERMEDYVTNKQGEDFDWELDEHQIQHLKDLGLWEEEDEDNMDGSDLISYL